MLINGASFIRGGLHVARGFGGIGFDQRLLTSSATKIEYPAETGGVPQIFKINFGHLIRPVAGWGCHWLGPVGFGSGVQSLGAGADGGSLTWAVRRHGGKSLKRWRVKNVTNDGSAWAEQA